MTVFKDLEKKMPAWVKEELAQLPEPEKVPPHLDEERKEYLELETNASSELVRRRAHKARQLIEELIKAHRTAYNYNADIVSVVRKIIHFHNAKDLWDSVGTDFCRSQISKRRKGKKGKDFLLDTTLGFLYCSVAEAQDFEKRSSRFKRAGARNARKSVVSALRRLSSALTNSHYLDREYSQSDIYQVLWHEVSAVQQDGARETRTRRTASKQEIDDILSEGAEDLAYRFPQLLQSIADRIERGDAVETGIGGAKLRERYVIHLIVNRRNFMDAYGKPLDKANVALTRAICRDCPDMNPSQVGTYIASATTGRRKKLG